MQSELIKQYGHIWRVFEGLVRDFRDENGWLHTGRGAITPARLSFHILKAAKDYLQDTSTIESPTGWRLAGDWITAREDELPSQPDILCGIAALRARTDAWLAAMDLCAPNPAFPWAGETQFALALFLLRHTVYHLGELSSLLNESRNGEVEDNYVKAL